MAKSAKAEISGQIEADLIRSFEALIELTYRTVPESKLSDYFQLTFGQTRVVRATYLMTLDHQEGISLRDLASYLNYSSCTASIMVDALVNRGVLERRQATDDRRKVMIRLSSATLEAAKSSQRQVADLITEILEELTPGELATFSSTMSRFSRLVAARVVAKRREKSQPEGKTELRESSPAGGRPLPE